MTNRDPNQARIEEDSKRWVKVFATEGYAALVEDALEEELVALSQLPAAKKAEIAYIAATIDQSLLTEIIVGNVAKGQRDDPDIRRALRRYRKQARNAPGIYLQLLVDAHTGDSPTPAELRDVIAGMESYCENTATGNDLAYDMESHRYPGNVDRADIDRGVRRYLKKQKTAQNADRRTDAPCATRLAKVRAFCVQLKKRLDLLPAPEQSRPLRMPISEVGYAANCLARLEDHAAHRSSNYVTNLADAVICYLQEVEGRFLGKQFIVHQFVIFNCWLPQQAILAEMFFTRIAHDYIYNGGGFSHYPTGLSNASVLKKNPAWVK